MAPIASIGATRTRRLRACPAFGRGIMKVWLSTEINRQHRSEKGRATAWRHDRRGHGSHVVMALHDFDRANDALLGATERRGAARRPPGSRWDHRDGQPRKGGRPPLTMMADRSPRPTKRSSSPTYRSLIHQSGCRLIRLGSSSESQSENMSAFSLREARADRVSSDLPPTASPTIQPHCATPIDAIGANDRRGKRRGGFKGRMAETTPQSGGALRGGVSFQGVRRPMAGRL